MVLTYIRPMARYCSILLMYLFFISCSSGGSGNAISGTDNPQNAKAVSADYLQVNGDSVLIPPFSIEVSLTNIANAQLKNDKETVIVAAMFSGQPKDTSTIEYQKAGEFFIKSVQVELDTARTAKFEGLRFSRKLYDSLAGKDINVLINIFSGRKSSPDNILDCNILFDKLSNVQNRTVRLTGKLIAEDDSTGMH